jgi:transmembrane 9 superfamily protein 2/4
LSKLQASKLKLHVKYGYHNNWIIDNLPSAAIGLGQKGEPRKRYAGGFPIGFIATDNGLPYVYNHVNINIEYHPYEMGYRVVGFAVEPLSVAHKFQGNYAWLNNASKGLAKPLHTCSTTQHLVRDDISLSQLVEEGEAVIYTYDVIWHETNVEWSSRWDVYLSEDHLVPAQVHWYSITNSILVVLFLSLLVVSILVRNLRRDIDYYNNLAALADEEKDEDTDETGWKLVHADVFRPPQNYGMLFCVLVGSGAQIAVTILAAIMLSAVGFVSPARRGSLMIAMLIFYVLSGVFAGYLSSRLYKAFRGRHWQVCTIMTALFFPGMAFGIFTFFNIILWFLHSSASAPFLDVLIVAAMWCGVSIPLVFLGAYFGYKAQTIEFPTVTSTIARAIPPPPNVFLKPWVGMILAGIIPFVAAYVELFFIMTSLWMDQFYYVFGFTLMVYVIMIITCAEVTVLLVYYQLCAENHRWWWYSFFCSGSTAVWTFCYSVIWFRQLEASRLLMTYLLYFGYMFLSKLSFQPPLSTAPYPIILTLSCPNLLRSVFRNDDGLRYGKSPPKETPLRPCPVGISHSYKPTLLHRLVQWFRCGVSKSQPHRLVRIHQLVSPDLMPCPSTQLQERSFRQSRCK